MSDLESVPTDLRAMCESFQAALTKVYSDANPETVFGAAVTASRLGPTDVEAQHAEFLRRDASAMLDHLEQGAGAVAAVGLSHGGVSPLTVRTEWLRRQLTSRSDGRPGLPVADVAKLLARTQQLTERLALASVPQATSGGRRDPPVSVPMLFPAPPDSPKTGLTPPGLGPPSVPSMPDLAAAAPRVAGGTAEPSVAPSRPSPSADASSVTTDRTRRPFRSPMPLASIVGASIAGATLLGSALWGWHAWTRPSTPPYPPPPSSAQSSAVPPTPPTKRRRPIPPVIPLGTDDVVAVTTESPVAVSHSRPTPIPQDAPIMPTSWFVDAHGNEELARTAAAMCRAAGAATIAERAHAGYVLDLDTAFTRVTHPVDRREGRQAVIRAQVIRLATRETWPVAPNDPATATTFVGSSVMQEHTATANAWRAIESAVREVVGQARRNQERPSR